MSRYHRDLVSKNKENLFHIKTEEAAGRILCHEERAQLAVGHEDTVHEDKVIHCWV